MRMAVKLKSRGSNRQTRGLEVGGDRSWFSTALNTVAEAPKDYEASQSHRRRVRLRARWYSAANSSDDRLFR